ncbi:hypothetical protein AGMMS50276_14770 [Synergistales bacterium]|nr:hypothetical protein AGMMS50276_14770 [Synergistales bacterium]
MRKSFSSRVMFRLACFVLCLGLIINFGAILLINHAGLKALQSQASNIAVSLRDDLILAHDRGTTATQQKINSMSMDVLVLVHSETDQYYRNGGLTSSDKNALSLWIEQTDTSRPRLVKNLQQEEYASVVGPLEGENYILVAVRVYPSGVIRSSIWVMVGGIAFALTIAALYFIYRTITRHIAFISFKLEDLREVEIKDWVAEPLFSQEKYPIWVMQYLAKQIDNFISIATSETGQS